MSILTDTAPRRIYLCISDDIDDNDLSYPELYAEDAEITWSTDQPVAVTVEYVRADTYDALQADLAAAREDAAAVRELMNCYNVGGWTDAEGPMKRALKAESDLAAAMTRVAEWKAERDIWCSFAAASNEDAASWERQSDMHAKDALTYLQRAERSEADLAAARALLKDVLPLLRSVAWNDSDLCIDPDANEIADLIDAALAAKGK